MGLKITHKHVAALAQRYARQGNPSRAYLLMEIACEMAADASYQENKRLTLALASEKQERASLATRVFGAEAQLNLEMKRRRAVATTLREWVKENNPIIASRSLALGTADYLEYGPRGAPPPGSAGADRSGFYVSVKDRYGVDFGPD